MIRKEKKIKKIYFIPISKEYKYIFKILNIKNKFAIDERKHSDIKVIEKIIDNIEEREFEIREICKDFTLGAYDYRHVIIEYYINSKLNYNRLTTEELYIEYKRQIEKKIIEKE